MTKKTRPSQHQGRLLGGIFFLGVVLFHPGLSWAQPVFEHAEAVPFAFVVQRPSLQFQLAVLEKRFSGEDRIWREKLRKVRDYFQKAYGIDDASWVETDITGGKQLKMEGLVNAKDQEEACRLFIALDHLLRHRPRLRRALVHLKDEPLAITLARTVQDKKQHFGGYTYREEGFCRMVLPLYVGHGKIPYLKAVSSGNEGFVQGVTLNQLEKIFTHELGHLFFAQISEGKRNGICREKDLQAFVAKYPGTVGVGFHLSKNPVQQALSLAGPLYQERWNRLEKAFSQSFLLHKGDVRKSFLSVYSSHAPAEFLAEAFALYLTHPESLRQKDTQLFEWMELFQLL